VNETPTFSSHMNESDAILWSIERDPALRTTIVAVAILDRAPDLARLRDTLTVATHEVPRLRQRVVEPAVRLGTPSWVDDDRFDLEYHLRRVGAPAPGDLRSVLDLAAPIAMAAFDKERPLWEFTVVEGLDGGRSALVQKIHHSFTDGVGGMALARLLVDDERHAVRPLVADDDPDRPIRAAPSVTVATAVDQARLAVSTSVRAARSMPGWSAGAIAHPRRVVGEGVGLMRSVGRMVAPVREPLSPVMRGRGLSRRLDAFELPLEQLSAAAHAAGGSLNDAFLAAVAGGVRRFHVDYGDVPSALRVTMPVNRRRAGDDLGNNRFTPVRFALPITELDPAERIRAIGGLTRRWRREPALPATEMIAGALNRLPAAMTTSVFGAMLTAIDLVATNVPGLPGRSYLAGAEVLSQYAFAPTSGAAFSIALVSHGGECCVGVNTDTAAVTDPALLVDCLRQGFDEVVVLA
jgi:diacylglycerol O-acyltransferase